MEAIAKELNAAEAEINKLVAMLEEVDANEEESGLNAAQVSAVLQRAWFVQGCCVRIWPHIPEEYHESK